MAFLKEFSEKDYFEKKKKKNKKKNSRKSADDKHCRVGWRGLAEDGGGVTSYDEEIYNLPRLWFMVG